ncbi:hypothetical protein B0O99DRAFT_622889 [Bisporella sp. PMI_857]|nr:hypothetical protein B0O99DRAFT_622889 [Bisporella sp. PMI_857]
MFQTRHLRWLVMPQFLFSCRPFCFVCCRIVWSKKEPVLFSCNPLNSFLGMSLQRSFPVIEIASQLTHTQIRAVIVDNNHHP